MIQVPDTPPELAPVLGVLNDSLVRVSERFDQQLESPLLPVQQLVEHVEGYRGKMLRPSLVILAGLACGSEIREEHVVIATVVEMVHMATLVHDDVLDDADVRRRGTTVNRLRGNEMAVILGDYLFSSAYRLCSSLDSREPALLIGQTGMTLCSGELLQLHHRENFSIDEPTYFEIVAKKTASLIAAATRLGALASDADADTADALARFGLELGVAFQIQDDLLDLLSHDEAIGKPAQRDVLLGKLTLPTIHHLAAADPRARGETLALLGQPRDATGAKRLAELLRATGSIEHARAEADSRVQRAKGLLGPLPDSPAKQLLLIMADKVTDRSF